MSDSVETDLRCALELVKSSGWAERIQGVNLHSLFVPQLEMIVLESTIGWIDLLRTIPQSVFRGPQCFKALPYECFIQSSDELHSRALG